MHDGKLMDLIAEALAQHGFSCTRNAALEGKSGTIYTVPLLAENEDRAVILDAAQEGEVSQAALEDLADVREDSGADHAVLCHLEPTDLSPPDHLLLWGKPKLVDLVGEARIKVATGHPVKELDFRDVEGPIAESLDELLPPAFLESPGIPIDEPVEEDLDFGFDLDGLEALNDPEPDAPETAAPEPSAAQAFAYPLLPMRVTADEARLAVKDKVYTAESIQMVLQPVHLIDYECDLLAEGSLRYDTIQGRVQVHGTDKSIVEVDPESVDPHGFTKGAAGAVPSHERTLRVSDERARELATAFLADSHTRLVDVEAQDDEMNFSYTEKKKVAPRPDHIRLNPLGTYYRVLWRVVGPNGHIDIDALTGNRIEEVLQAPNPDAMIID